MCKSTVVNYLEELKNLKKIHPEHLEYINDCEKCKVKPSKICERLKSRIKALQLV